MLLVRRSTVYLLIIYVLVHKYARIMYGKPDSWVVVVIRMMWYHRVVSHPKKGFTPWFSMLPSATIVALILSCGMEKHQTESKNTNVVHAVVNVGKTLDHARTPRNDVKKFCVRIKSEVVCAAWNVPLASHEQPLSIGLKKSRSSKG